MPTDNRASNTSEPPKNDLLWIHQDAQTMGSAPQRHTIFSHVQSNYRAQKRRVEAKALRASALKGRTAALQDPSLQRIPIRAGRANRKTGTEEAATSESTTQTPPVSENRQKQIARPVSPLLILRKGNSDPFHSYPIAIGPEENRLMGLYRDQIIPAVYFLKTKHKNFNDKNLSDMADQDWRDNVAGLQEKGTALGTLARYAAISGRNNPLSRQVALKYTGLSTQVLREKVSQNHDMNDNIMCLHINMLFNAEIVSQNLAGAVAHGRVFRHLFKQQWDNQQLDYKMLLYQLHNDMQLTSTFLTRPIFDEGDWLTTVLKPLWDAAAPYIPTYPDTVDEMDPSIEGEVLCHWFKQRRKMILYEGLSAAQNGLIPPLPLVSGSFMASSFLFHSRMIGHYLDTEEEVKSAKHRNEFKADLFARQALALGAALLRKWTGFSPRVEDVLIYDNKLFMDAFRRALERCEACQNLFASDKYRNAQLWALYIGALVERGSVEVWKRTSRQWFNITLAELATRMGIVRWEELKVILQRFIYEQSLMSQGSIWFEELIVDHLKRRAVQQPYEPAHYSAEGAGEQSAPV